MQSHVDATLFSSVLGQQNALRLEDPIIGVEDEDPIARRVLDCRVARCSEAIRPWEMQDARAESTRNRDRVVSRPRVSDHNLAHEIANR